MDCSILPEGSDSKSLWPGWEGSATILPARLRVLETGPGGMVGCSWSPSQWNKWYAAVCPCPWQWQQRTRWWWVRWRWTRWWQCRKCTIIFFGRLNFPSYRRKYILCWAFLVRELMFSSHLRSWVMMVPSKQKDSTESTGESHRMMVAGGAGFSLKSTTHLHCF